MERFVKGEKVEDDSRNGRSSSREREKNGAGWQKRLEKLMPKPMKIMVEVEEFAFGRVFRILDGMEGVVAMFNSIRRWR